jgi:dipeptide/tripeptide permease
MISFYWPQTNGEWLGFAVAAITLALGLMAFVMPRIAFALTRLQPRPSAPDAVAEARATLAGPFIALGLGVILLAQPLITLVLGAAWGLTAIGRLVSMLADRAFSRFNALALLFEGAMALAALAGPLMWVA